MEKQNRWNTFFQTGKVTDYLEYLKERRETVTNSTKEERGHREGTSDGNGAFGSNDRGI